MGGSEGIVLATAKRFASEADGPVFFADTVGLRLVMAAIERFAAGVNGAVGTPAFLLVTLATAEAGD